MGFWDLRVWTSVCVGGGGLDCMEAGRYLISDRMFVNIRQQTRESHIAINWSLPQEKEMIKTGHTYL